MSCIITRCGEPERAPHKRLSHVRIVYVCVLVRTYVTCACRLIFNAQRRYASVRVDNIECSVCAKSSCLRVLVFAIQNIGTYHAREKPAEQRNITREVDENKDQKYNESDLDTEWSTAYCYSSILLLNSNTAWAWDECMILSKVTRETE